MCLAVATAILIGSSWLANRSPEAAPPKIFGAYRVTFAGTVNGEGKAVVNPNKVKIDGKLKDKHGKELDFSAPNLDVDVSEYRFKGLGMLGGSPVKVSGRLDPDDKTLKKCRIAATFVGTDGNAGRVVGERK
jgi:hypothetical protein